MVYGIVELSRNLIGVKTDASKLRKDEFWSLEEISFELKRGEVLGLIGANGSGKTTLLRLIAGIYPPDKGEVIIKGRVGALISLGAGFHPHMTGRENIYLNGTILGMTQGEISRKFDEIIEFAEIEDFIDTPVAAYSSGMRVRLGFSIAAQIDPDVLLIDEVLAVGDIGFRTKCLNAIDRIARNSAVIFVSHQMPQVTRICSEVILLDHGKVIYQGNDCIKGVEHYFLQIGSIKENVAVQGDASVKSIELYSDRSVETQKELFKIEVFDTLYIRVRFSLAPRIRKAIVNFVFFTRDERTVAQCDSNNYDFEIRNSNKDLKIIVKLANLPFNPGRYYLSLVILDENRHEILTHVHAIKEILVVGSFMGYAPVQLQGEWGYV